MRIPNAVHESHAWRIREIAPDFTVEDVWALPVYGGAADFKKLLEVMASLDPTNRGSFATRLLFRLRWRLGRWFRWDDPATKLPIPGEQESSLAGRLPNDLRNTAAGLRFPPFTPLYRTRDGFAAGVSDQTRHPGNHPAGGDQGRG